MRSICSLVLWAALVSCISVQAQRYELDSLIRVLPSMKDDTVKAKTSARAGFILMMNASFDSALIYFDQARRIAEEYRHLPLLHSIYANTAGIYWQFGDYPQALDLYFLDLRVAESMRDEGMKGAAEHGIGLIYQSMKNDSLALLHLNNALVSYGRAGMKKGLSQIYNNRGSLYKDHGRYKEALDDLEHSLALKKELHDTIASGISYNNIGNVYHDLGDEEQALRSYLLSYALISSVNDEQDLPSTLIDLGETYLRLNHKDSALLYINRALALSHRFGFKEELSLAYQSLALIDSATGDFGSALRHYRLSVLYNDSLINDENTRKTVETEMQYEFDRKTAAVKSDQEKKDAVADAEMRKQRIIIYIISIGLIPVFFFCVFIYRIYRQKKKANTEISLQKEVIEQKQNEIIDSIHYAKRIQHSMLPSARYIQKNLEERP